MSVQDAEVQDAELPEVPDSNSPIEEARTRVESTVTTATQRIREWQAGRSTASVLPIWLVLGVVLLIGGLWVARRVGNSGEELMREVL